MSNEGVLWNYERDMDALMCRDVVRGREPDLFVKCSPVALASVEPSRQLRRDTKTTLQRRSILRVVNLFTWCVLYDMV